MSKDKKPFVWYRSQNGTDECRVFDTYAELRKSMGSMMRDSIDQKLTVTRTRRGEWGQWFEVWEWNSYAKKNVITKQGWQ